MFKSLENSWPTACYFRWNSWKLWRLVLRVVRIISFYAILPMYNQRGPALFRMGYWMFTKKPDKWKKYSVSIIVLATSFVQIWSSSDFSVVQVTSVEKRESREHFSASAYGLGFKKLSFNSLFSTSVTLTTLQSDEDKFVLRLGSTIIETKYYFSHWKRIKCFISLK